MELWRQPSTPTNGPFHHCYYCLLEQQLHQHHPASKPSKVNAKISKHTKSPYKCCFLFLFLKVASPVQKYACLFVDTNHGRKLIFLLLATVVHVSNSLLCFKSVCVHSDVCCLVLLQLPFLVVLILCVVVVAVWHSV